MFDYRPLGLEIKVAFLSRFLGADNPKMRTIRKMIGQNRLSDWDHVARERAAEVPGAGWFGVEAPEVASEVAEPAVEVAAPAVEVAEPAVEVAEPDVTEVETPAEAFAAPAAKIVKSATIEMRDEADNFQPQTPAKFEGVEPATERPDGEKRRDLLDKAEPPRQDMVNDFIDMTLG